MSSNQPSFLLRGVDPEEVLNTWKMGGYETSVPRTDKKVEVLKGAGLFKDKLSKNENDALYFVNFRNCGGGAICARTGFRDVMNHLSGNQEIKGSCEACGKPACMGYPTYFREVPTIVNINGVDRCKIVYCFWTEGRACSLQHCLAIASRKPYLPPETTQLIHLLHSLMYPNAGALTPDLDPLLLEENGGPLSKEDWESRRYNLQRTSRVILTPAQIEYRTA